MFRDSVDVTSQVLLVLPSTCVYHLVLPHKFETADTMPSIQSRRWCFTVNNPSEDECQQLTDLLQTDITTYAIIGQETGANGTPHLQGFVIFENKQTLFWLQNNFNPRAHYEPTRGTSRQASDYCKKEDSYEEFGTFPNAAGKRTDIEEFTQWCRDLDHSPSDREIANAYPSIFVKYPRLIELVTHIRPHPVITDVDLRGWQVGLDDYLSTEPDDRSVMFCIDELGGAGKSTFVKYQMTHHPDITQFLSIGKRDDISYAIDETKRVFLFDIPRGSMQFLQYSVLEKLKDQMVFSTKYQSKAKILHSKCHVVVFCNEQPDMTLMTHDRYIFHDMTID